MLPLDGGDERLPLFVGARGAPGRGRPPSPLIRAEPPLLS